MKYVMDGQTSLLVCLIKFTPIATTASSLRQGAPFLSIYTPKCEYKHAENKAADFCHLLVESGTTFSSVYCNGLSSSAITRGS